jgi:hypothetical protein
MDNGAAGVSVLRLWALVLLASLPLEAAAGDTAARRFVDLDRPGAVEALRQSNPTHFEKIRQIVGGIGHQPDARVPGWMRASFDARDVTYAPIEMTSYPLKRRLAVALDDTRYSVVVTVMRPGRITPAQ